MHYWRRTVYLLFHLTDLQVHKGNFGVSLHPSPLVQLYLHFTSRAFIFIIFKTWFPHRYFSVPGTSSVCILVFLHLCMLSRWIVKLTHLVNYKLDRLFLLSLPWNDPLLSYGFQHPFFVTFLLFLTLSSPFLRLRLIDCST